MELFPPIPYEGWSDTIPTLHRFAQVVGKVRLAASARRNQLDERWILAVQGAQQMDRVGEVARAGRAGEKQLARRIGVRTAAMVVHAIDQQAAGTGLLPQSDRM